jgi:type IV secretion system protein VirD4
MLDEAANIAPLRRLDRVAAAGANQGIVLVSAWQDEGQTTAVYGPHRARTVLSNHTARMYLPGVSDEQTLRALSAAIGDHQVRRVTETRDAATARRSRSTVPHDEPVAPVEWLRRLPDGEAVVLTGRHKPMHLRVSGWYEDPALRALVDPRVATAFDRQFALR